MRWVFYALLILNLVYLVWGAVQVSGPGGDAGVARSGVASAAPRSLELLSETGGAGTVRAGQAAKKSLCPVIGPWSARLRAEDALAELENSGYRGVVRALQVDKERLNWVYLPAYETREKALEVLHELQSRGVDSFVVGTGEDENAISLGYFISEESAEGLRVKMNNAGYPARVRLTARTVTEYWIYLASAHITDDGALLRRYLQAHPELEADHAVCPGQEAARAPEDGQEPAAGSLPEDTEAAPAGESPTDGGAAGSTAEENPAG